jgi:hypothetical protein
MAELQNSLDILFPDTDSREGCEKQGQIFYQKYVYLNIKLV